MKKIEIKKIDLTEAFLITEDDCGNQIWRFALDSYAITAPHRKRAIIAFKSHTFSAMLGWLQAPIKDFALLQSKCLLCEDPSKFFELRILTEDGIAYSLDSFGAITEQIWLEEHQDPDPPALHPSEICGVEDSHPYDRILISKSLVPKIEEYGKVGGAREIIDRFWAEFSSHRKVKGARKIHHLIGDFCAYSVNELPCGRFVFLTAEEGLFIADEEDSEE